MTSLQFDDEQVFRIAFRGEPIQYAHSWLYALRAAHDDDGGLGFKYIDRDLVAVVGYRRNCVYITPIVDRSDGHKLQRLCHGIFEGLGCRIVLKKVHAAAFENTPSMNHGRVERHLREDDSFPERILRLQKLFKADGSINQAAHGLLRQVSRFEELGVTYEITDDLTAVPPHRIRDFLERAGSEKRSSYLQMVHYLTGKVDRYHHKNLVFSRRGEVAGLYLGEVLSHTEMGLYCGLTAKNIHGMTEWMDVHYFRKIFFEGTLTVHLGGTETAGVAGYIRKLIPHNPSYVVRAALYDHSSTNAGAGSAPTVRPAKEDDFGALAELYRDTYNSIDELGENWTSENARKFIAHFYGRQADLFFVAEREGTLIGAVVAAVQPWWDGNRLVEGELFVDSSFRHCGVERQLLKVMLSRAQDTYHVVAWDTITPTTEDHPLGSYRKMGFAEVPQWKAISGDIHTILGRLGA